MPVLSIIVPVYKVEKYLPQCIDSILAQTITDYELILVDDGSPDRCGEICDDYAMQHSNIKVIHKQNEGLTRARQSGIAVASGTYVAFVDSDDWIDPDMYATLLTQAEEQNADLVAAGYTAEYPEYSKTFRNALPSGVYRGSELEKLRENAVFSLASMMQGLAPSTWNKLYRRSCALDVFMSRTDRVSMGEDALFTYPTLFKANCVVIDNTQASYHYRILNGSMSHKYSANYFPDIQTVYDQLNQAAKGFGTQTQTAVAYNYVFLFANGMGLIMSRKHKTSFQNKCRLLASLAGDVRLKECLQRVDLAHFPGHTAVQIRKVYSGKPMAAIADYYAQGIAQKARQLLGR